MKKKNAGMPTLVFGAIAAVLLVAGAVTTANEHEFLSRAVPVMGRVTYLDHSGCPEVTGTAPGGKAFHVRGKLCSSPPSYRRGDHVPLLWSAQSHHGEINDFWQKYVNSVVLLGFGTLFALIALWASRTAWWKSDMQ